MSVSTSSWRGVSRVRERGSALDEKGDHPFEPVVHGLADRRLPTRVHGVDVDAQFDRHLDRVEGRRFGIPAVV